MCSHACLHNTIYIFFAQISKAAIKNYQMVEESLSIMQTGMRTHYSPQRETIEGATLQTGPQQPSPLAPQRTAGKH